MDSRSVIVNATDPNIQYVGQWIKTPVDDNMNLGGNGPPYSNMLMLTTGESSLSFKFSGSSVQVVGRNNFVNNPEIIPPKYTCSIDGVQIPNEGPPPADEDNFTLCNQAPGSLADGEHSLFFNVTTSSLPFYFDNIGYLPSSSVSLSHATMRVSHTDPAISYSSTWKTYDNFVNMTQTAGSEMTFSFIGKSVTWIGYYPPTLPQNKSEGMYFIDDEAPGTSFTIFSGDLNLSIKQFNQIFFKTGDLNPGPHILRVVYQGSVQQMGLSLRWLLVANDTNSNGSDGLQSTTSFTSSGPATATLTHLPSSSRTALSSNTHHKGALIGGIVGGVVVAVAIFISLYVIKKKRQRTTMSILEPNSFTIVPAILSNEERTRDPGHRSRLPRVYAGRKNEEREIIGSSIDTGTKSGYTNISQPQTTSFYEDSGLRFSTTLSHNSSTPDPAGSPPSYTIL